MNVEQYLLVCLMEELSEMQQEVAKCLRFTKDHTYEHYDKTNLEKLELEYSDVHAIIYMLRIYTDTKLSIDDKRFEDKFTRTKALMKKSEELGALNDSID